MRKNNLVGEVFGRLTVYADVGRNKKQNIIWGARCVCGGLATATASDLKAGKVKSCGCLAREGSNTTHGMARGGSKRSRVYSVWAAMLNRCSNPNDRNYASYGGRGICVCKQWSEFTAFLADMGEPPPGHSLDRTDNDGPYSPHNCRWVTRDVQSRNKRSNVFVNVLGVSGILADVCRQLEIKRHDIYHHKKNGMTTEEAILHVYKRRCCKVKS